MGHGRLFATAVTPTASKVPTDFVFSRRVFVQLQSGKTSQIWNETHGRHEVSAWMYLGRHGRCGRPPHTVDGLFRVEGSGCASGNGADGETIHVPPGQIPDPGRRHTARQGNGDAADRGRSGADERVTSPWRWRKINEMRAHHGLDPLESDGTIGSRTGGDGGGANLTSMSGWDILDRERHLTLWLEGRQSLGSAPLEPPAPGRGRRGLQGDGRETGLLHADLTGRVPGEREGLQPLHQRVAERGLV